MRIRVVLLAVGLLAIAGPTNGSFWDSVPAVSKLKSLVQAISGDTKAALKTQENFLNQALIVSQVKSLVELAKGDPDSALETQKQFLQEFLEPLADNTPIVGHIKGAITFAAGDEEKGVHIMTSASSSTIAVLGGVIAGPGGAIAAGAACDVLITGLDSAANGEYRPYGTVDFVSNIHKQSAGEHFDAIMGIGTEFVGGKGAKSRISKKPGGNQLVGKQHGNKKLESTKSGFGATAPPKRTFGTSDVEMEVEPEPGATRPREHTEILEPSHMDLINNPSDLQFARKMSGLPKLYAEKLQPIDFYEINDVRGTTNCYLCCIAAMKGKTVSGLLEEIGMKMTTEAVAPSTNYIVDLYKMAGFKNAANIFAGTPERFREWLGNNIDTIKHIFAGVLL